MTDSFAESAIPITGDSFAPPSEGGPAFTAIDSEASAILLRMLLAFMGVLAEKLGRIAPSADTFRITFGPGKTPRVTLFSLLPAHTSDGRAWHHVEAGRSKTSARVAYVRACVVQAACSLLFGDTVKALGLVLEAHGAEKPDNAKPEAWARALEGADGAIGEAYAALVTAQDAYGFAFGSKPRKTGKEGARWVAEYTNSEGKKAKLVLPASWVPDPSGGTDPEPVKPGTEIPSEIVLFGVAHPVIVRRVVFRK